MIRIFQGKEESRYYDQTPFLEFEKKQDALEKKIDVDFVLGVLEFMLKDGNILWFNLLDRLYRAAPSDERVINFVRAYQELC